MREIKKKEVKKFQQEILEWFSKNKRDLLWRDVPVSTSLGDRAYRILVSEVMLQQTQVSRVIPKYEAWLKRFPTMQTLAKASTSDVLRAWSGLGYNRRALYLKKTAEILVEKYSSSERSEREVNSSRLRRVKRGFARTIKIDFPQTEKELRLLPGIGEYTARAVLCFAFDKQVAVVDTNVRKVILLRFKKCHCEESKRRSNLNHNEDCHASLAMTAREIQNIADQLLPKGVLRLASGRLHKASASEWNQALMDYSAMELRKVSQRLIGLWPKKVPLKKQSAFKSSNRYFRGQLIKLLLQKKKLTMREVQLFFKELYGEEDPERLEKILIDLVKDTLIKKEADAVILA